MSGSTDSTSSQESKSGSGVPAISGGATGLPRDMISLDEVDMVSPQTGFEPAAGRTNGGGKGDTLMQAAEAFEQQLQHMSAWKHQLASQMELLRRDGIKMLERQKNLAVERGKLRAERDALEKEKAEGKKQQAEAEEARKKLDERAASLEQTTEALMALQSQKEKWIQDLSAAREATEKLSAKRAATELEVAQLETQAAEYRKLAAERDTLLGQIHDARSTLEELSHAQKEMLAERQAMEVRAGELRRQGEEFAERERKILGQETILREAGEQLEGQRKALVEGQLRLTQEKDQLQAQIREQAKWLDEARHQIETEQVASKAQVAAAEERLRELSEAQKKFEIDKQELANRAISLEGQELQLAKREADVAETVSRLKEQEATLKAAQDELAAHQAKLSAAESTLAGHRAKIEAELAERIAAAEATEASLKAREAEFVAAKQETQKKLDDRELSIAEELEHVAKQTKRLNDKRAEIDAEASRLEATIAAKVKAATEQIRAELTLSADAANAAVAEQKAQVAALEEEIKGIGEKGKGAEQELAAANAELASTRARVAELEEELKGFAGARERIAELEAMAHGLEKDRLSALDAATELNRQIEGHRSRETATAEAAASVRGELAAARAAGETLRAALTEESAAKAAMAEQVAALKLEITSWREKYEAAQAMNNVATGDAEETDAARSAASAAQARLAEVEKDLSAAEATAATLRQEIAAAKSREKSAGKNAASARQELEALQAAAEEAKETLRRTLVAEYEQKLAAAKAEIEKASLIATSSGETGLAPEIAALRESVRLLEAQRDELGADLLAAQDAVTKARNEAAVSRAAVEAELTHLRVRCEELEHENQKLAKAKAKAAGPASPNQNDTRQSEQRARLLRQARGVRAFRKQQLEVKGSLESSREEIAQQREQLHQRKENLEQVKRLLEKQEMVMARKLADHSAIKTVAAVIISVVMILGGTFMAVYRFVSPVYGSEALVQVTAPASLPAAEANAWLAKQADAVRSDAVTFEAWKKLRSNEEKYGGHESREEWLASLPKQLAVKADTGTRTLSIQYESSTPDGAAQVCNALASAYVANVAAAPAAPAAKSGATELAKAFGKPAPKKDGRLMTALTSTAALLLVALIAVMLGRYYVRRQLREIDRMADEAELEDIKADLPAEMA